MRRSGMFLAAWMLMPLAAFAQQVVKELPATLQLDINAQGQVTAVKVMDPVPVMMPTGQGRLFAQNPPYGPMPAVLAQAAAQVAARWRFQPIHVAGKATTGRTWAWGTLQVVKRADGNFGIDFRYKGNGPYLQYRVAPRYPERMIRQRITGALAVEYVIQPDGSIGEIRVLKTFGGVASHQELFEQAIRKSLGESKGLPLMVDGKAVATRMRAPFTFSITGVSKTAGTQLDKDVDSVVRPESARKADLAPLASGESVAVDSPFVMQPSG